MLCPACHHPNSDEQRFCGSCGVPLRSIDAAEAQSTLDYFYRLIRQKPSEENLSSLADYNSQVPPSGAFAEEEAKLREQERALAVSELRDATPNVREPGFESHGIDSTRASQDTSQQLSSSEKNPPDVGSCAPNPISGRTSASKGATRDTEHHGKLADAPSPELKTDSATPVLPLRDSSVLAPEVIAYDRQVPIIAEPGIDRRRAQLDPRLRAQQNARGREEERAGTGEASRAQQHSGSVRPRESSPSQDSRRGDVPSPRESATGAPPRYSSVLGLDSPASSSISDKSGYEAEVRIGRGDVSPLAGEYGPVHERSAAIQDAPRTGFLDFSEPRREVAAIHGPSFLGLGGDEVSEYGDESRQSHSRRNVALVILALLLILAAVQWRSIRDFGVRYAQNGTMSLPLALKRGQPAPAGPAANSTANLGSTTANSNPEIVVEPARNPNAATTQSGNLAAAGNGAAGNTATNNAQPPSNSQQSSASPHSPPANSTTPATSGSNSSTPATTPETAQKASNRNEDVQQGEPGNREPARDGVAGRGTAREADSEESAAPGKSAMSGRGKFSPSLRDTEPAEGGAAELAQATAAGNPSVAAAWLWKAVGKGNSEAAVRLADMYVTGRGGITQNCDQGLILLRSAASKKNARARSKLGSLYATGSCVAQDRVAAYHWMSLALQADPGSEWIAHNRNTLWQQMSSTERAQAGPRP
ncbi:MAG TPA: zinc-ribbon domain-containing protein [Clostridia bacterium]|nr:zinc-ribbon domain-containing protein [Clostridia bacterium]